jgi:hypothetical protein
MELLNETEKFVTYTEEKDLKKFLNDFVSWSESKIYSEVSKRVNWVVGDHNTHIASNGSSHTFIDQDVTSGAEPTFTGTNFTGIPAAGVTNVVSATANITDHAIVRGHGGAKVVQGSSIIIDDSDNVSGMGTLSSKSITILENIGAPSDLGNHGEYQLVIGGGPHTGYTAAILLHTTVSQYGGSAIVHYDTAGGGKGNLVFYTKQSSIAEPPVEVLRLTDAGVVQFGTHSAIGAETLSGYITINDSGGTPRKIGIIS